MGNILNTRQISEQEKEILIEISKTGNVAAFEKWLENLSADVSLDYIVNVADTKENSLLHFACQNGHLELSEKLLQLPCNIHKRNIVGKNAFHLAAESKHIQILDKLLIASKTLVNSTDNLNRTPLFYAAKYGHASVVHFLLRHKARMNIRENQDGFLPIHVASAHGKIEIVKLLTYYDNHAAINDNSTKLHWTPLYLACQNGHLEVVDYLLQVGASVNIKSKSGWTVLHTAVANQYLEITKRLCTHDYMLVNEANHDLCTPLYLACQNGDLEITRLLLDANADLLRRSKRYWTVFHIATRNRHLDTIKVLHAHHKRCVAIYKMKNTNVVESLEELLHCRNGDGDDILDIATKENFQEIVTYIKSDIAQNEE